MRIIVLVVPARIAATAQSIYGTLCLGLTTALLTAVSGVLYEHWNGTAFLAMALLCLLALPLCIRLQGNFIRNGMAVDQMATPSTGQN
jgi:PPP family 3-phenylpropionic acid transporter